MSPLRLSMLLAVFTLVACSGGGGGGGFLSDGGFGGPSAVGEAGATETGPGRPPGPAAVSDPGGPAIVSFGASATSMTEGDAIVISAVFETRTGKGAIAGGVLLEESSGATVASFKTASASSLEASVSWKALHAAKKIQFAAQATESRALRAQFFDGAGRKTIQSFTVTLTCSDLAACDGKCTDTDKSREHCGTCGNACPMNQAGLQARTFCLEGTCAKPLAACAPASPTATCNEICAAKGKTCSTTCVDGTVGGYSGSNVRCDGSWATPNCTNTIGGGALGFGFASCCCL
ncbi:MAG: hypothetical protein IPG50_26745 [Myxococcales bacterium]|nr:hypothetical protein [Myxococcales bacterium]